MALATVGSQMHVKQEHYDGANFWPRKLALRNPFGSRRLLARPDHEGRGGADLPDGGIRI
ncbi:hypothetical protein SBBP2_70033 [Burkholderiales bacterium]|nr:hypothetical protein SBBP2_70033 [Burkholderiales bacterium]